MGRKRCHASDSDRKAAALQSAAKYRRTIGMPEGAPTPIQSPTSVENLSIMRSRLPTLRCLDFWFPAVSGFKGWDLKHKQELSLFVFVWSACFHEGCVDMVAARNFVAAGGALRRSGLQRLIASGGSLMEQHRHTD